MTKRPNRPTLITGGAGFIGSHVVERFRADGHRVVVIDDLSTGDRANLASDVELIEGDIASAGIRSTIARLRPSLVVHAAAQPSVSASMADPATDARTNVIGSINVFAGAADAGTRTLIYVNTGGALYGASRNVPATESEPILPVSPYGASKLAGEHYLRLLRPSDSVAVSLRLANVYGPRQSPHGEAGVVAIFAERMLRGMPIEVHGDGLQSRDFIYVEDVAEAVAAAAATAHDAAVNVGTGRETTILELVALMQALTGSRGIPMHVDARPGDVRRSALDATAAARLFGWRANTSLQTGLERTVDWYRAGRGAEGR